MSLQAQDLALVGRDSLIPPKLTDYQAILKIRAEIRAKDAGNSTRVECLREIEKILGRVR